MKVVNVRMVMVNVAVLSHRFGWRLFCGDVMRYAAHRVVKYRRMYSVVPVMKAMCGAKSFVAVRFVMFLGLVCRMYINVMNVKVRMSMVSMCVLSDGVW